MKTRILLPALSLLFSFLFSSCAKPYPDKQKILQELQRARDSEQTAAEMNRPLYQKRMGNVLRDVVQKMKDAGITRDNAKSKNVHKNFSNGLIHIDSVGRIEMELYFRNLDLATVAKLEEWGVQFSLYGAEKGAENCPAVVYFKEHNVPLISNSTNAAVLLCNVPFDVVEEVAKLPCLVGLNAIMVGITD